MNIKPPRHCFGYSLALGWQNVDILDPPNQHLLESTQLYIKVYFLLKYYIIVGLIDYIIDGIIDYIIDGIGFV